MDFRKATAISFYCLQYYKYDHCFFYSFATSWDFTYIVKVSKREEQTILNSILSDRRRTIRKIRMAKRKNLDKKITYWYEVGRADLWWEYFVSRVTPKDFWKKNVRLEEASFFDLVPHLRPYISPNRKSHSLYRLW